MGRNDPIVLADIAAIVEHIDAAVAIAQTYQTKAVVDVTSADGMLRATLRRLVDARNAATVARALEQEGGNI